MENLIGIKLGVLRWCHSRVEAGEREMSPGRDTSSSFFWVLVRELLSVGPCPLALPRFILNVMGDGSLPGDALSLMHHPPGTVLHGSLHLGQGHPGDLSLSRPISSLSQNHFMTKTKGRLRGPAQQEGSSGNISQNG